MNRETLERLFKEVNRQHEWIITQLVEHEHEPEAKRKLDIDLANNNGKMEIIRLFLGGKDNENI